MKPVYISWAPHCSRSDYTARELGGASHMVYWGWLGSHPATVWLKYLGQTLETWWVLLREHPDAVFVMAPPPFAILAVFVYCQLRRIPYVIDAHSGMLISRRWRPFRGLHYWLCRRAATTIVSNDHLAAMVRAQGAVATVVPDVPVVYPHSNDEGATGEPFNVVCVTSFGRDEPIEVMVEAARLLPDVRFFMTGNARRAEGVLGGDVPPNLVLTGFLDNGAYGALIRRAGVVLALTTDQHTMLRSAYEAIYQGTPVIVSDTEVLREAFDEGGLHVRNVPRAVVDAILKIQEHQGVYRAAAERLRLRKMERWGERKEEVLKAVRACKSIGSRKSFSTRQS